jgi:hypothetical protein
MGTLYNDKEGTISYINTDENFTHSLETLNSFINPSSTEKPEYITTRLNAEDITILYGKQIVSEGDTQQME